MAPRKTYILKLYVAGNTANSMRALKTLRNILDTEFQGVYALKVIDVLQNPQLAEEDKILATPTLAKILPPPVRRIIGDLSDREKVLIGLDLLYDELSEEDFGRDDGLDSAALNDAEFATDRAFPYDRHAHSASPSSADQTLASAGQPGSPERTPTGIAAMGPGPAGGDLESPVALPPLESP
jgi:circadian clock protein KaiB